MPHGSPRLPQVQRKSRAETLGIEDVWRDRRQQTAMKSTKRGVGRSRSWVRFASPLDLDMVSANYLFGIRALTHGHRPPHPFTAGCRQPTPR